MRVDVDRCTGCGECLEVCSNDAISLVDGKAHIDINNCLSCGACEATCPQNAIVESRYPVRQEARSIAGAREIQNAIEIYEQQPVKIQPVEIQTVEPAGSAIPVAPLERRYSWLQPVLSYLGWEILPRLADTLITALERRLSTPSMVNTTRFAPGFTGQGARQRQVRRRRRGK